MTLSESPHQLLWARRTSIVLLKLVCANLLVWRSVDPDLWGHIQYGEDWMAEGSLPRLASHTYSAPDHRWINHENLSELALAGLHRLGGGHAIVLFRLLSGLTMLSVMIALAVRRGVPAWAAAVCMVPVASGLGEFWLGRPQLASFLCMAALLTIVELAFCEAGSGRLRRPRMLLWCPPLMVVWTNAHGGFAAGLCVLLAIFGIHASRMLLRRDADGWRSVRWLSGIAAASTLAVLFNPYGLELPLWMLESLGQPRPEISEWASVFNGGVAIIPFLALTTLAVTALTTGRQPRDPARLIVLALVAVQAAMHIRHIAFLAILSGFWLPPHLWGAWQRWSAWRQQKTGRDPAADPPLSRGALALIGLEAAMVALLLAGVLTWRVARFGVDRSRYPVSAIAWMAEQDLHGRLIVTFNWAQYALAALQPETTVCFDGRFRTCYPQNIIDMNFDFTNGVHGRFRHRADTSEPPDPARVLRFRDPQLVLLDRTLDQPGIRLMQGVDGWTLLYRDGLAELWGRTSEFGRPDAPRFVPPEDRRIGDEPQRGIAAWPAMPGRSGRMAFVVPPQESNATDLAGDANSHAVPSGV